MINENKDTEYIRPIGRFIRRCIRIFAISIERGATGSKRVASQSFRIRIFVGFLTLCFLLFHDVGATAGGSDTSGYLNGARLLGSLVLHPQQRVLDGIAPSNLPNQVYIPLGFAPYGESAMYPTYPLGLPVSILLASKILGWQIGPDVTMSLYAIGAVMALYLLSMELGLGRELALLGGFFLGSSVLFLHMSFHAMSDTPSTMLAVLTVLFAIKAQRTPGWAALAGISLGFSFLVRPTNILMIVPVAVLMPRSLIAVALFGIGAIPFGAGAAILNHLIYGNACTTGYGDVLGSFSFRNLLPSLRTYAVWLPVELTPLVLGALAFPFLRGSVSRNWRIGLAMWISTYILFYAAYYHTHETWWYLRFILPAFPAIIIAVLFCLKTISPNGRPFQVAAWVAVVCGTIFWTRFWAQKLNALEIGRGERAYLETCEFLQDHVGSKSVVLCMQQSGAIYYYTDYAIVRWDTISNKDLLTIRETCKKSGRQVYLVLSPFERNPAFTKFPNAKWNEIGWVRDVGIWSLSM